MPVLKPNPRCLVTLPPPTSLVPMEIGVSLAESTSASWGEVFHTKPKPCRKVLQEEITRLRSEWRETIWRDMVRTWERGLREIVGVPFNGIAVTGLRFLIEMRGIKEMGGKILHIEAADQLQNIAPELRGHRSEMELQSPEVLRLRDDYIFNSKDGLDWLKLQGERVLGDWGWA